MRIRKKSWEDKELSTNEHLVHEPEKMCIRDRCYTYGNAY